MGNHIFICYAREDQEFVLELAQNLKKQGLPIWLDQWDITPSEDWDIAIDDALAGCVELLIILSPTAVVSREVRGELRTALDDNKAILPVLYRDCRIPRQLRITEYVDFRGHSPSDKEALQKVLSSLKTKTPPSGTKTHQEAHAQSTSTPAIATPNWSRSFGASRLTPPQDNLKRYSATSGLKLTAPTATTGKPPPLATVEKAPEPEFYQRWTWWVSLVVIILFGMGGALLADWLLSHFISLDTAVMPGRWLAFIVAGILFGVTFVALCVDGFLSWEDYIAPLTLWSAGTCLVGWGLAFGATLLAARFLPISPALAGYLVFGAVILFVVGHLVNEELMEDWGRWLMVPLLVLLSIGAIGLIDRLIGLGLAALGLSVPEMTGKWLAFLLTGIGCGIAYLSADLLASEVRGVAVGVGMLSLSFVIAWGFTLGAAYLTERYLSISYLLVGYIVYSLTMFCSLVMTAGAISEV